MTDAVQVFNNPEFGEIRIIMIDDEPWWIAAEIAKALGYTNTRDAIRKHVDGEDKNTVAICDGITGNPNRVVINESGLYSLILSSKLPSAKRFKRWVTSEVLPAIRKTGRYEVPEPEPEIASQRQLTVDDYLRAASIIAGCRNERIPTVLALLEKGGIAIPMLEEIKSKYEETGETAALINRAITEFGMNQAQIAKLCGLHPTQIMRIRTGQAKPKKERAVIIQNAIRSAIAE